MHLFLCINKQLKWKRNITAYFLNLKVQVKTLSFFLLYKKTKRWNLKMLNNCK